MTLYITGDVHGSALDLAARARAAGAGEGDEVLVLGDLGLAYGHRPNGAPRVDGWMAQLSRSAPWTLVVMRGNHDVRYERDLAGAALGGLCGLGPAEPAEWRGGRAWSLPRIGAVVLPDAGGLYDIDGVRTLVAPGAWSVDGRFRRVNGLPFEREEALSPDELAGLAALARDGRPEAVLSHTCPESFKDGLGLDPSVWADDSMELAFQGMLDAAPSVRRWAFGHFHGDRRVAGGRGRLMYRDIAPFGDVAAGTDEPGSGRPYEEPSGWREARRETAYVMGGGPDSGSGYTVGRLCELLGCGPGDVSRALYGQTVGTDPETGEDVVYAGDVASVVAHLYGGGLLRVR